jgi:hypothetical protein
MSASVRHFSTGITPPVLIIPFPTAPSPPGAHPAVSIPVPAGPGPVPASCGWPQSAIRVLRSDPLSVTPFTLVIAQATDQLLTFVGLDLRDYVRCAPQKRGWRTCPSKSLPAVEIEHFVLGQIHDLGNDRNLLREALAQEPTAQSAKGRVDEVAKARPVPQTARDQLGATQGL